MLQVTLLLSVLIEGACSLGGLGIHMVGFVVFLVKLYHIFILRTLSLFSVHL